uniref:Uncharacterized protein n=1 Tax=Rhizophora mucronata TaxID=61149 RepID=A0A2P2MZ09_RHIMU
MTKVPLNEKLGDVVFLGKPPWVWFPTSSKVSNNGNAIHFGIWFP